MQSELSFRSPSEDDLDAITDLESVSFPSAWKREFFESEVNAIGRYNLVVEEPRGALVAYLFTMYYLDEMHVNKIAVDEDWKRFGIASSLMGKCFEFARANDIVTVSLEVRETNQAARALYGRLGFAEVHVRQRYYSDGEAAVVMSCSVADASRTWDVKT